MFICNECVKSHKKMRPLNSHEISSLEDLKHGRSKPIIVNDPPTKKCQVHEEPLIIYCFDCGTLICHLCTVKDHREHNFEFCKKAAASAKETLLDDLKPVEKLHATLVQSLGEVQSIKKKILVQQESVTCTVRTSFQQLHQILKQQEKEILEKIGAVVQEKVEELAEQEKKVSLASAEVQSIVDYTNKCVKHCADDEFMGVLDGIKKKIEQEKLQYEEKAKLVSSEKIDIHELAGFENVEVVKNKIVNILNPLLMGPDFADKGKPYIAKLTNLFSPSDVISHAESLMDGTLSKCTVVQTGNHSYSVQFTPTNRGRHQLSVSKRGQEVEGSPLSVLVSVPPHEMIRDAQELPLHGPCGIAVDSFDNIIATQYRGDIIKYNNKTYQQQVLVKYAHTGLNILRAIALDRDNNIYCVDEKGKKIMKCDQKGGNIQVHHLTGAGPCNGFYGITIVEDEVFIFQRATSGTIIVCSRDLQVTRRIQHSEMGHLSGMTVDTHKNMYVCDQTKSLIRVFSVDGTYQRSFGFGENNKPLIDSPWSVRVSGKHVWVLDGYGIVHVFTTAGDYVMKGDVRSSRFHACVNSNGFVILTDYGNNKIQIL